jgi:hypothetical protein
MPDQPPGDQGEVAHLLTQVLATLEDLLVVVQRIDRRQAEQHDE